MPDNKHHILDTNAGFFKKWIENRGGVAVWTSINLSNPGASWSTPALTEDGKPYPKPNWQVGNEPTKIITDPNDIIVDMPVEVKRFHVAIRRGSQGLSFKLTDASSARLRKAVDKMSKEYETEAWYEFDYSTQEAVIFIAGRSFTLPDFFATQVLPKEASKINS